LTQPALDWYLEGKLGLIPTEIIADKNYNVLEFCKWADKRTPRYPSVPASIALYNLLKKQAEKDERKRVADSN